MYSQVNNQATKQANRQATKIELNVNASEFISLLTTRPSSAVSMSSMSSESLFFSARNSFAAPSSLPSPTVSCPPSSSTSPPSCNIQNWWFENKTLFDDSYDDMKKIFGWSKVPIRKTVRKGELSKLNVEMEHPSKKVKTCLIPIKEEILVSYASVVLRKTLSEIRVQA